MTTECSAKQLEFHGLGRRAVVADFTGGAISSDGGGLLLREVERHTGIIRGFAQCFRDGRSQEHIEHSVEELVSQRVMALALGYEDLNDHDRLRADPLLAVMVGKGDPTGEGRARERDRGKALAGKSTLNRLELGTGGGDDRYKKITLDPQAVDRHLVATFLAAYGKAPRRIVVDIDATDDPLHGAQEGRFFHGYYGHYCYLPLYIFCGEHLLCARLRPANIDPAAGAVEELSRIVEQIRGQWPKVRILLRGDSGFCREQIMSWCEEHDVDYLLGLAKNNRLIAAIEHELSQAKTLFDATGRSARVFKDFDYCTRTSWSCARRVVGKAEHLSKGSNPRFVVSSLDREAIGARHLYERIYCARGDMENRIKEQQLALFADRTSSATLRANQLRLYFSSLAYVLMHALRRLGLQGTAMARAQCQTIRCKLLKIGAQIRVSVRRVWVALAESYPYADLIRQIYVNLQRVPLRL